MLSETLPALAAGELGGPKVSWDGGSATVRKAGGIIAVISGLLALGATFLRQINDSLLLTLDPGDLSPTQVGIDFANGLLFSSLAIVLGAILIGTGGRPVRRGHPFPVLVLLAIGRRIPGLLLIAGSLQELYYNELSPVVLLFLLLAAVGGVVSILPDFGAARRTARPTGG